MNEIKKEKRKMNRINRGKKRIKTEKENKGQITKELKTGDK